MEILSISAFLITLRETMEAALIVGILLAYLSKTDNTEYRRDIWLGTGMAVVASIIGAAIVQIVFGGFKGNAEKLYEGIVMITAALVLAWMIIWMFRNSVNVKRELEEQIATAIDQKQKYALVSLAFISVFREGIETVLFMSGIESTEPLSAVLFSGTFGILIASALAVLVFRGSIELNMRSFFNITSIILIFFAAGLFAHGIHEFQELQWFGAYETSAAPFWNVPLWNTSSWLSDGAGLGQLFRTLFGYQDKPTLVEILAYVVYWIVMALTYFKINLDFNSNQTKPLVN